MAQRTDTSPPWLPYTLVVCAVLAMAWGGPLFAALQPSPPFLCAAWRLTLTSVLMVPGVIWDVLHASPTLMQAWLKVQPLLIVTGVVLAFHFCTFSWSVSHTSFSHAMIIVSITPMLLVLWALCLWFLGVLAVWQCGAIFDDVAPALTPATVTVSVATAVLSPTGVSGGTPLIPGDMTYMLSLESQAETYDMEPMCQSTDIDAAVDVCHIWEGDKSTVASLGDDLEVHKAATGTSHDAAVAVSFVEKDVEGGGNVVGGKQAATSSPNPLSSAQARMLRAFVVLTGTPSQPLKPSVYELGGSVIAFSGVVLLVLLRDADSASSASTPATLPGDVAAVLASLAMVWYLIVGARLRQWLPIWMYTFPLTLSAGVVACGVSLAAEEQVTFTGFTELSLFGWLGNPRLFGLTFAAAFVPGILGHTLANYSLQRVNPLVLSVTQLVQPGISMLYGYAIGVQDKPNAGTFIGAPVIICGIAAVLLGSRRGQLWIASVVSGLRPRQWCGMSER